MHRLRPITPRVLLFLLMLAVAAAAGPAVLAQSGGAGRPTSPLGGSSTPRSGGGSTFGAELPPVERAINPEQYRMGPNDQLIVTIPALEELSAGGGDFPVVVSADNVVGLPRGVRIDATGMTLADFRRAVTAAYARRGGALDVSSVRLVRPRSIYVTVRGDVMSPGRQVLTASDRVSTAVALAGTIPVGTPEADIQRIVREQGSDMFEQDGSRTRGTISLKDMPRRNVTIRHNDGTTSRADFARFAAFGRDEDNPSLREGDEIIVMAPQYTGATVAVAGAVNSIAMVEYRRGDNALMLARLGAGLQSNADPTRAYIARRSETGQVQIAVDYRDTSALAAIELEPGDRLIVPMAEARTAGRAGFVVVEGAVGQPSAYPVISGETMLTEVIGAAGGFAPDASINGAYVVRESDPGDLEMRSQIRDRVALISTSSLTLEDTTRFKFDQMAQRDRVSVDFVGLFERGDRSKDISLRTGDRIVVPQNTGSVYVSGRVILPGAVDFREGADVDYYVNRAGGYASSADPSRTQIIKFGTGNPLDASDTPIEPGDEIYVVGERDLPARTPLEVTATAMSVVGGLTAATWALINIIDYLFVGDDQ